MSDIKAGDLAIIVKLNPCCGGGKVGVVVKVKSVQTETCACVFCGRQSTEARALTEDGVGHGVKLTRLKKIDPPAEGDSLPTRANLDQPVTA